MSDLLTLKDDAGRTLRCELLQEIPLDDKNYGLVLPEGTPVRIMAWTDSEEEDEPTLEDLDDEEIAKILPTARAVLAEQDLKLLDSAFVLVVTGEVPIDDRGSPYAFVGDWVPALAWGILIGLHIYSKRRSS